MGKYIEIRKAAMYLEDRDAVMRTDRVFCFIKRFADEYELNGQDVEDYLYEDDELETEEQAEVDEALEPDVEPDEEEDVEYLDEVYLYGFCEIKSVSMSEVIDLRLMGEDFEPKLVLIEGTINGKVSKDENRLFNARVETNEVFVSQADLDQVSENYGIPKREDFDQKYLKSIKDIKSEYNFLDHQIFYPDEVDSLDEMNEFYGTSDIDDSKQQADSKSIALESSVSSNKNNYAIDREQVLGCLLALMAKDATLGRGGNKDNIKGKLNTTELRDAIEANARFFWKTGSPPLSGDVTYKLISKWLNLSPDKAAEPKPPFSGNKSMANRKPWSS